MTHTARMRLYHRHRFPADIISHCVWLYFRFAVSFRDLEEMLAMRSVSVSYETIREWWLKFGQNYANGLRRPSPRPRDRMAPRRGIPQNQRTSPLSLARSGPGWRRFGHLSLLIQTPTVICTDRQCRCWAVPTVERW
jgi:hypothetical protein